MTTKLFIAGLPYTTTEAELTAHFAPVGNVVSVTIPRDRETDRPKGIAFVELATSEQAAEAIRTLHESTLGNRRIVVATAKPREARGYSEGRPVSRQGRDDRY